MALPEVTAKLTADVNQFIQAWNRAAAAAQQAAARIRAAQAQVGDIDIDAGKFRQLNAALDELTQNVKKAGAGMREFGASSKQGSSDIDRLGEAAKKAGSAFGGSGGGGGGLVGGLMRSRAGMAALAAAAGVLVGLFPAIAAAVLASGAAMQALGVAGAVVAGGWRGIEQAGERLKASLGGLQKQLESVFRAELSQEFQKLGQAISTMDGPLKAIARSVSDVVKEFTGWIRSSQGMEEIQNLLGGVDNMMKSLAPGAKALAQAFTGFGEAAAPALDDIGKALSSVFENINKVIQKGKETGQLTKAFEAGAVAIEAFGEVAAGIIDILIEIAGSAGKPAAEAIKSFGKALQDAAPYIGTFFQTLAIGMQVIGKIVELFAKLLKALEPAQREFQKVGQAVSDFIKNLDPKKIDEFGKAITAFALKLVVDIKKGVDKAVESVKKWWDDTKKAIKEGVDKVIADIKKWWTDTKKAIDKGVQDAIKAVKKWWDDTKKAVKEGVDKVVQEVKKWWEDTKREIEDGVDEAIQAIKEWADSLADEIQQGIDRFLDEVKRWWDETVQGIADGVQKAVDEAKKLPDKALKELQSKIPDFKGVGEDMGEGMAEGLRSAAGKLASIAAQAAANALRAAKAAMGIRSPSSVMRDEVGAMMAEGWAQGIIANAGLVTDAMQRTALGALGAGRVGVGGGLAGRGQSLVLQVGGGADTAVGVMIARLAQQGKLKITANAVVGGRR